MAVQLSLEEYDKAMAAGLISGNPCGCMGPQGQDEFCPCEMNILEKINDADRAKMRQRFVDRNQKAIEYYKPKNILARLNPKRLP